MVHLCLAPLLPAAVPQAAHIDMHIGGTMAHQATQRSVMQVSALTAHRRPSPVTASADAAASAAAAARVLVWGTAFTIVVWHFQDTPSGCCTGSLWPCSRLKHSPAVCNA